MHRGAASNPRDESVAYKPMGIPPIVNPGIFGGQPTCPDGYYYDPGTQLCQPIPGSPTPITRTVTAWGPADPNTDPVQSAKNWGVGLSGSGFIGAFVAALWHAFWLVIDDAVNLYFNAFDRIVAFVADQVGNAVTRSNPGLWIAIGSLLSDLLGVNLDGSALFNQLATRGTLPAMQAVGGSLIDLLVGEFTGTASGTGGNVTFSTNVDTTTGLPPATLTPLGGLNGAKALMGFVLTSAVRQANVDGLVDAIPFGFGKIFEKYSEGVRTNLGIGRMMRFALKPLFQDLVATPLKWAINMEYRPTLLSPADAYSAFDQQVFTADQLHTELARHGYSDDRFAVLEWKGRSLPSREELRGLHATGLLADADYLIWQRRTGYTDPTTALLDQWEDMKPARTAVLKVVGTEAEKYLGGKVTAQQFQQFVQAMQTRVGGAPMLTAGEVNFLLNLPALTAAQAKHKNLGVAQMITMYEDGIITLQDFENELTIQGYDPDQIQELVLYMLVKAKAAAEKAAAAAAKAAAAGTTSASTPPANPPVLPPT